MLNTTRYLKACIGGEIVRILEVRRHARRERPAQHLSQRGVEMARRLGKKLGPFDRVVCSPLPRCVETAVAMGFAVDEDRPELAGEDVRGESFPEMEHIDWDAGYAAFGQLLARGGPFAAFANAQAAIWRDIARALPEGGRGLIVGHGGFIEAGAVAAFPGADHAAWGRTARRCEGILLHFEADAFTNAEILRVPKKLRKAE
jgi:broad specificity phosphatase PhoE